VGRSRTAEPTLTIERWFLSGCYPNPRPAEKRTRALLEQLDPTLSGSADIDTLAKRWSRDVHHLSDRDALTTLAGRMVDRGLATATNDPYEVARQLELKSRQAASAVDDSGLTHPSRGIPYASL
jgi:hypothetical protein